MSGPRYPAIPPEQLTPEQRVFHDEMETKIKNGMGKTFTLHDKNGALLGPLSIMMHTPQYSTHTMRLNSEVLSLPALEPGPTEVAIMATQGYFTGSFGGFLTYSHSRIIASKNLLSEEQMKSITEGVKPDGLSDKESVAFDLAMRLVRGGKPLEQELWEKANDLLGKEQTLHIIQVVAYYSLHGITLNAGIIGAPEGEQIWKS
jgi:4-carboxymuconolactone decarboxylase